MKTHRVIFLVVFSVVCFVNIAAAQISGRRVPEFSSRQEYVSLDSTMPFDRAIAALSEVSKRFTGKVVIDVEDRTYPIGISIKGLHWRDALDLIGETNGLRIVEKADYIEVKSLRPGAQQAAGGAAAKPVVTIETREVLISSIFFTLNLTKSIEYGIDWSVILQGTDTGSVSLTTGIIGAGAFEGKYTRPFTSGSRSGKLAAAIRLFSLYDLGEIISSPRIIVRTGEQGRVQVGQDISVIERTITPQGTTESVKQLATGSILTATPEIITEGDVTFVALVLDIDRSAVTGGTPTAPIIDRNQTTTKLLLVDGEEVFISGMYTNRQFTTRTGIPVLKDLPPWFFGLRYIFGSDEQTTLREEFAILLKVELLPTLKERATKKIKENAIELQRKKFEEDLERFKSKDR